ncbi:hypothetical protein XFF6990_390005 [Xanthomonas citri pv. fuscans]|nr:hypothetical protein XFF6990_390005 [Xanthomonas citri pv. fuscans]
MLRKTNSGQYLPVPAYSGAGRRRWLTHAAAKPLATVVLQTRRQHATQATEQSRSNTRCQEGGAFHTGCAYGLQFSSVGHNVPVRRRYVLSHLANAHAENSMVRN